jgi:hypothetical protein
LAKILAIHLRRSAPLLHHFCTTICTTKNRSGQPVQPTEAVSLFIIASCQKNSGVSDCRITS